MVNPSIEDMNANKGLSLTNKKEHFLTAFTLIAIEAMNEYQSNIRKPVVKEVRKPNQKEGDQS